MQSAGAALRAFEDLISDDKSTVSRHPEDYSLAQVGTWDDQIGFISPLSEGPRFLDQAIDVVQRLRKKSDVDLVTRGVSLNMANKGDEFHQREHFDDAERRANGGE